VRQPNLPASTAQAAGIAQIPPNTAISIAWIFDGETNDLS